MVLPSPTRPRPAEHHRHGPGGRRRRRDRGKVRDKGFRDEDLKAIGETLTPETSAIIAVAEDHVIERLQRGIEGYQNIARHGVDCRARTLRQWSAHYPGRSIDQRPCPPPAFIPLKDPSVVG